MRLSSYKATHAVYRHQQSSLTAPPRLQQAREVAALPELGNAQLHRPHTRIPRPGPVPVALGHPLRAPFSILSTNPGRHLRIHDPFYQDPQSLPQEVHVSV